MLRTWGESESGLNERLDGVKAPLFPRPGGHALPVISGLVSDRAWIAEAMGVSVPTATKFRRAFHGLGLITDVPGVEVGHTTLISGQGRLVVGRGPVRTGVTAVWPRGKAEAAPEYAAVLEPQQGLEGDAVAAPGGAATEIETAKQLLDSGAITVASLSRLYPYDNTLRAVRISGAALRAFLEHSSRYYRSLDANGQSGSTRAYRFPLFSAAVPAGTRTPDTSRSARHLPRAERGRWATGRRGRSSG